MLGSLIKANPATAWKSFYRKFDIRTDTENIGSAFTFVAGSNFSPNVTTYVTDFESHTLQCIVRNYTDGQTLTLRCDFFCTVNTGTKTWTASLAAITAGDAQSVLTKTFGTGVVSAATAPNATVNALYTVDFVFDTAAKLNNLENGDLLVVKLVQTASSGTHGTAYLVNAEIFCS